MSEDVNSVGKYLKKINDAFQNQEKKSFTDILIDFNCMSEDYQKMNENLIKNKITYSNSRFDLCTPEEQNKFFNDQLQFIETLVTDKIWFNSGVVWNWFDIFSLMHDPKYKATDKQNRKVVFSTAETNRPIGDQAYNMWNGLQIIDIDIKNEEISKKLKPILFNELKSFPWFLGVCLSASGRSLHVWTKIKPITNNLTSRRIEFRCNFRQKYSYLYIILSKYMTMLNYTKEDIISYLDNAMAKPQQGIFISSDNDGYMNTGFQDLRLDATFEAAINTGIESINWITHPDLKEVFKKLEWFDNDSFNKENNVEIQNIEGIDDRDKTKDKGPKHYKHNQRWQLANTLNAIYGASRALEILLEITIGTPKKELSGDVRTASIHKKPISKWAVDELNKFHGFNIKIKEDVNKLQEEVDNKDNDLNNTSINNEFNPIYVLNKQTKVINLSLKSDQYLSDIKEQILGNLSQITLLEAGAGYGKTEMIKAFKSKVLLILPFTSIIKSKIELDEKTSDWLYYYGSKKPTIDELFGNRSITMTIDKFSHLNLEELNLAKFEYIVIDESHLLFTSSYRDVMSPTIQRLANCKAKVIMMTGTPTAEVLFFPKINHIKVRREETRIKEVCINMVPTENEVLHEMALSMAMDVKNGVKVLWPTNKGTTYFEQVTSLVQHLLYNNLGYSGDFTTFYYKKSNYGDNSMDSINKDKSIGNNDIIGCTTYLSVGVDICDAKKFHVYFNEMFIGQDIEQYANRLRRNDLYVKIFLPRQINGVQINWDYTKDLDLQLANDELVLIRDLAKTANDMIERNQDENKYNPLILSMLSSNKFLKYDETDAKYYIDETSYKLKVFEDRYTEYAKQLSVLKKSMQYYGYNISTVVNDNTMNNDAIVIQDDIIKGVKHRRWDENTRSVLKFLSHITDDNIDLYREIQKGNYALFKDDEYKEERGENNLYVESIEVLEKNVPIVMSLYRFYTIDTIKEIYNFCIDSKSNRLNQTKLDRIRRFINIEYNKQKKKLDFPIIKFIKDAQAFAEKHPTLTQNDINKFQADYTVRYVNSIEGLVVQDSIYLNEIFDLVKELWNIVIIQSRPGKNKQITITPFKLTWIRKDLIQNAYGNVNTQEFFAQVLEEEMIKKIEEENKIVEDIDELPEFERKSKVTLDQIKDEIKDIVHQEYDYDIYSKLDNSNERFLRKQENTSNANNIKETIDNIDKEKKVNEKLKDEDYTIFSDKEMTGDGNLPV